MRRAFATFISVFLTLALVHIGSTAALATDTRAFQPSVVDKSNPKGGISGEWDLTQLQVGITTDDELEIFALTKVGVSAAQFGFGGYFVLSIDTNLDKNPDFQIDSNVDLDSNTMTSQSLIDVRGGQSLDCEAYVWITPNGNAVGWQIPISCLSAGSQVNLAVESVEPSGDGFTYDRLPDGTTWAKFSTQYLKVQACSSKQANKKMTYKGTTWICLKSGSSWSWRDYAPIAAKNARFLTEKAYYLCKLNGKFGALLEDGGKTLTLEGAYKYFITEANYNCVAKTLGMPKSVDRRVGITRALDGVQEAKWGKISAFWNYHPDDGLDITFSYN